MKIHTALARSRRLAQCVPMRVEGDILVHALVFAALTFWSWRKWPDPLIDFGRELYTPWQLANGKVLYRDVASLFGPFSQYFNAFWFQLFGASFTVLIVVNLIILALVAFGIRHLVLLACDRFTASAATLVTLFLFGFSQYSAVGNYNFVSPYSHEATHSIALAVGVMVALVHGIRTAGRFQFATAGVLFGLLSLTKAETSLAMTIAVGLIFAGWWMLDSGDRRVVWTRASLFLGAALVPVMAFFFYFRLHMPTPAALRAVAGSWAILLTTTAAENQFYAVWLGFDDPLTNALKMLKYFGGFLVFVAIGWALDRLSPRLDVSKSVPGGVARRMARIALLLGGFVLIPWDSFPRALPMIAASGLVVFLVLLYQRKQDREAALKLLVLVAWTGFSLALQAKMILNARIYHYGFYLGLPATIVLIVIVAWLIPMLIAENGGQGRLFRSLTAIMLMAAVGAHLAISNALFSLKGHAIASGPDRFYAFETEERWEPRGISEALSYIQRNLPTDATIVVLPEGVMINYLARRENPTPYISFMLPELRAFGESRIREALAATPPDFILLLYRDTSEYGVGMFGTDVEFGKTIMDWVNRHYRTIELIGDRPVHLGGHGIEIMALRSARSHPEHEHEEHDGRNREHTQRPMLGPLIAH